MRRPLLLTMLPALLGLATLAPAQIGLPQPGPMLDPVIGAVDRTLQRVREADLSAPLRSVSELARDRLDRLRAIARANPERIELDDTGAPARRGIILLLDADPAALEIARAQGFTIMASDGLDALGIMPTSLAVPDGMSLARALGKLRAALPGKTISADTLSFPSAASARPGTPRSADGAAINSAVGLIDGGVSAMVAVTDRRGFAAGAPSPSDHGTAIAGLLRDVGVRRIYAADVYGDDPAGGGALAIAKALNWLVTEKVPVISVSLVGPPNPLLARAIAATQGKGAIILAAVGNDGPAAPPAYPASYPSVLAITGVDGRNRALIEAGRALHIDYAAPGADLLARNAKGDLRGVRGTSFAVPLAAARVAAALDKGQQGPTLRRALDAEASDLGRKGADKQFGRGLLCGACVQR